MTSQLILHEGREKSLKRRHPWIFSKAVKEIRNAPQNGADIEILSSDGTYLATGSYSPNSQIRARVWTFDREQSVDHSFFVARISEAAKARELMLKETGMSACRLVDAESDGLPGLTVDKFGDYLSFQIVSLGLENFKQDILEILVELLHPLGIYERNDLQVREKEGLPQRKGCVCGTVPPEVEILEHDAKMLVDIPGGQKTGHFLDQQENRGVLKDYVNQKTVLDLCCCTGGFSVHAGLYGASRVDAVDVSESALELVLGVASIAGIFAIRKYLYVHSFESHGDDTSFEWFRSETEKKEESKETDAKDAE